MSRADVLGASRVVAPSLTASRRFGVALVVVGMFAASAEAQTETPVTFGPISEALRAEAARMVQDADAAVVSVRSFREERADRLSWDNLRKLKSGDEVRLTRLGVAPARYPLLTVRDDDLLVFDLSSAAIPARVARTLRREAESHPGLFNDARLGSEFHWNGISIGPSGVSQDGRLLVSLPQLIIVVPRVELVEVEVFRTHVGRNAKWGAVVGAGAFLLLGAATCSSDCGGSAAWGTAALAGAFPGVLYGAITGGVRTPDLIYRRPVEYEAAPGR